MGFLNIMKYTSEYSKKAKAGGGWLYGHPPHWKGSQVSQKAQFLELSLR